MNITSKPAKNIALASFIVSLLFFAIAWFVGQWSGFFAVSAICWLLLSASLIWLVLLIQFHQRTLAEQEKLDLGLSAKNEQTSAIFQTKGEHAELLAIAQRRLAILEKWFLPIFSVLIAIYQIAIGLFLLRMKNSSVADEITTQQPLIAAVCMTAIAFVSFLLSRYATGMAAQIQWKPLRAGGSSLLGAAFLAFALAITLALYQFKIFLPLNIIEWIIPVLLVVLGAEIAINAILDIYRPRLKGKYSRAAIDSRLLGLVNEPGAIFHTAASTIDYQFGFKVSQTWFYKLLEKAIVPLILFAAVTLYALSCVVTVAPNEEAVIEHFGNPVKTIGPGLACKWPWPIDIAYKYPTGKITEINIGFVPDVDKDGQVMHQPLLWGKAHYKKEDLLLVASPQEGVTSAANAVAVSLIVAAVPVQYKIKDLNAFIYNHKDPEKLLESICYQQLTRFAASARIEASDNEQATSAQESLLGAARTDARKILMQNIQAAADKTNLGVEIVFLGLQGIHPPPEVAADYQKVVGAVQKKQARILYAHAQRNRTLSVLAGSVENADELYSLAVKYQLTKEQNNTEKIDSVATALDSAFTQAKGDIFKTLRLAQSYAFEKEVIAKATGEQFASQIKAYNAAPEIYKKQLRLITLEDGLSDIRKFIIVGDRNDTQIFTIDLQEKLTPNLYELAGFEENKKK
jgi:modulator of FtsH protease HflK